MSCLPANGESVDNGHGNITQKGFRNMVKPGSNPNTDPLGDVSSWKAYEAYSGRQVVPEVGDSHSPGRIIDNLRSGNNISINTRQPGSDVGHSVVVKSFTKTTITRVNGQVNFRYQFKVMDPYIGHVRPAQLSEITNAYHIFYIH